MRTIAVTGTNGKTSVCSYLHQLGLHVGLRVASSTSIGFVLPADAEPQLGSGQTLATDLDALAGADIEVTIVETVSRAIAGGVLGDHLFDGVAILDITGDHLDEHGGFERYAATKRALLDSLVPGGPAAVTTGYPSSAAVAARAEDVGADLLRCGRDEPWALVDGVDGDAVTLRLEGEEHEVGCQLPAGFARANLVPALALADRLLGDRAQLLDAVPLLTTPSGRMEVAGHLNGAAILVDNSHNAGALEAALRAARVRATGRVVVVFGCGGERDQGKRPLMGSIAAGLADVVFVTDDNPRSEDPASIRAQVIAACPRATEIPDRREAVWTAMESLTPGDVLLVAGRGAESLMHIGGQTLPLSDVAIVRAGIDAAVTGA